jgi:formate dehydrogenase subunit gamma
MELFRVSRDVYGREVLQGVSWDLLWVFFAAGVIFVAAHALWRWLLAPQAPKRAGRTPI